MTAPDWLTQRSGTLTRGLKDSVWTISLNGVPLYRLSAVPAKGKFTCAVSQTNNGRRLDDGGEYASLDAALQGGLAELKTKLGW